MESYFDGSTGTIGERIAATFNSIQSESIALGIQPKFTDMVQHGADDQSFYREIFYVVPRFIQLSGWMIRPSKNTNTFLFKKDEKCSIWTKIMTSMVIGDGINVKVIEDDDVKIEDTYRTDILEEWLESPCGAGPDSRGHTINSWVLPLMLRDNIITGESNFHKFIGFRPISPPEEVGKLMLQWIDPRTYIRVTHPFFKWTKLIQYPTIQYGAPSSMKEFMRWNPTVRRHVEQHVSNPPTEQLAAVHISSSESYRFNLFIEPPMNTAIQKISSKIVLEFLRDRFIEKATYPFFIVKVPRHIQMDPDDDVFKEKLLEISDLVSKFRAGDCFAIEGEKYTVDNSQTKITLDEGWVIEVINITDSHIDFESSIRSLNEGIAHSLMSSMALISSIGVQGRTSTLTTGGQINQNIIMIIKDLRKTISAVFKFIFRDVLYEETGEKIDLRSIDISFSKIREEDAAQFLNTLISYHNSGALTTNELRTFADRIGLDLKPFPDEMTPEGRMAMGLDEMFDQEFAIPESFLKVKGPETRMEEEIETINDQQNRTNQK